jgi:GntR family transcriptional regulator/MocR family aminotransferase
LVKHAAGALMQTFAPEDRGGDRRARVYRAVVDAILDGRLAPGTRLPSARQLASEWKLARGVVDEAFARLQDEGLLVRRVGDGSYVAYPLPRPARSAGEVLPRGPNAAAQRALAHFAPRLAQARRFDLPRHDLPAPVLHPRAWPQADFPLSTWRRAMATALSEDHRDQLGYGPAAGLPALREAIARHVALTRSVRCMPEQVLVVNSTAQGLETVARVLLRPGDRVWVEDPGHPGLPLLFEMLHLRAVGVPLDEQGLQVARGRELAADAALAVLHPLTQVPLGQRTSALRGAELLQWAEERGAWIVEGCCNDEIVYRGPAPPALYSRDATGRVLLLGSFEGVMFPALRVAYLVVPERLVEAFGAARGLLGDHTQVATQLALASFIAEGHLASHLRQLRTTCGARREALLAAVRRWLPPDILPGPTDTGLHACLHLPARWPDVQVAEALQRREVGGQALSARCWQVRGRNGLVVGYGGSSPIEIDAAVRQLAAVIDELAPHRRQPTTRA